MSNAIVDSIPLDLVAPAIKAARAALRRLDEDDVPARLRKVAAYQGGRLPAPLARKLLAALNDDEWLRGKALEELTDASGGAQLFLERLDGWS